MSFSSGSHMVPLRGGLGQFPNTLLKLSASGLFLDLSMTFSIRSRMKTGIIAFSLLNLHLFEWHTRFILYRIQFLAPGIAVKIPIWRARVLPHPLVTFHMVEKGEDEQNLWLVEVVLIKIKAEPETVNNCLSIAPRKDCSLHSQLWTMSNPIPTLFELSRYTLLELPDILKAQCSVWNDLRSKMETAEKKEKTAGPTLCSELLVLSFRTSAGDTKINFLVGYPLSNTLGKGKKKELYRW